MILQGKLPSGGLIRVRVLVRENAGAICMKRDAAARLCLTVPLGAPEHAGEMFLSGWMPDTWPQRHAPPGSRKAREMRGRLRGMDRERLARCLEDMLPQLQADMDLQGIAWDTDCGGKMWARFLYAENRISFHPALGLQEERVIREVALHELLHTRFREHVPAFWQELTRLEPEWPFLEGRLRNGKLS